MIDLLTQPEHLLAAKAEFEQRTGGGIGGSKWIAPMLDKDFTPPTYLKWPEYITTAREKSGVSRQAPKISSYLLCTHKYPRIITSD